MANYTKTVDFSAKDALLTGNPLKLVKGTEIDTEFNNISNAISTKANSASPTFTGTVTGAIANWSGLVTASLGLTVSGAAFASRGITDNATTTALTINADSTTALVATSTISSGAAGGYFKTTNTANSAGISFGVDSTGNAYANNGNSAVGVSDFYIGNTHANNTGVVSIFAKGAAQVKVLGVASANRYIELSGSNAGNQTINSSAGALLLNNTDNSGTYLQSAGKSVLRAISNGTVVNSMVLQSRETGVDVQFYASGDAGLAFGHGTTGGLSFNTNMSSTPTTQVQIYNTPSANRYLRMTGSNGGNCIFDTFAGGIAIGAGGYTNLLVGSAGGTGVNYVKIDNSATNPVIAPSAANLVLGTGAALATNATAGHICIPTCAGTPTGAPTGAGAGQLPLIYDTTNNIIYAYNGAWKKTAALT